MSKYADIMDLSRPASTHPKMRREERAKLFAPFAALSGHDEAVHARDKVLVPQILLEMHSQERLDRRLQNLRKGEYVTVTWFVPLKQTAEGTLGEYRTLRDRVRRLDVYDRVLVLEHETIYLDDLKDIRGTEEADEHR